MGIPSNGKFWNCWHFWQLRTSKHHNHSDLTIMSDTGHNLCLVSHISLLSCGCVARNHWFPLGGTFWFSLIREEMRLPHWMFQPNNYHVEKRVLGGGEETDHQWTHGFLHIHRGAAPALHTHYHLTRLLSNQHTQPNNLYSSYWIAF